MSKEVEITREIIVTYLGSLDKNVTIEEAILIGVVRRNDILLEHGNALINIFTKAKEELERMQNE